MKEINDWKALMYLDGKYKTALPLPGCYISGKIDNEEVLIKTSMIDFCALIVQDINGNNYYLYGAKPSYLEEILELVELSRGKRINEIEKSNRE